MIPNDPNHPTTATSWLLSFHGAHQFRLGPCCQACFKCPPGRSDGLSPSRMAVGAQFLAATLEGPLGDGRWGEVRRGRPLST